MLDSQHFLSIRSGHSQLTAYNRWQFGGKGTDKKNTLNYWMDMGIGCAFVLSALSGLVFLLPAGLAGSTVLGLDYATWDQLHTWSSLGLIAGVLVHLALHWKWIASMTRKMTGQTFQSAVDARAGKPVPRLSRRRFLALGLTTVVTGILAAGGALIAGTPSSDQATEKVDSGATGAESKQPALEGVACPRGLVNDPYPGHCRRYTDRDGDGICDYSVPGSGYN
jgi:hypothetical protein